MNHNEFETIFQEIKTLISKKISIIQRNTCCVATFGADMNLKIILKNDIKEKYPKLKNKVIKEIIERVILEKNL